jgi:hypothetical protein
MDLLHNLRILLYTLLLPNKCGIAVSGSAAHPFNLLHLSLYDLYTP